jgi:diguanylate cyclase (GGDEF)-like protein/PAS domain S-box-containing protein
MGMSRINVGELSRERFELALMGTHLGAWDWHIQTGELALNERWAEMIGYRLSELHPISIETWTRFAHPDDLELSNRLITDLSHGKTGQYDVELRMRHREGHWIWVRDRGRIAEWGRDGKPTRMAGTHEDITELVLARNELASSEGRLKSMFTDHGAVMLLVEPASGSIIDANAAAAQFYGYAVDQLRSMSISDINALSADEVANLRREAVSRRLDHFIFPHRLASGEIRTVEVHSSPIEDKGRTLLFSIIHDVTERESNERELREAAAVFDNTSEAIIVTDGLGTIRRINPALTALTGWSSESLIGQHASILTGDPPIPGTTNAEKASSLLSAGFRAERPLTHADGSETPSILSINPIRDGAGGVAGFVALISDISERVRAEHSRLDDAASIDPTTGLPNRAAFTELLVRLREHEGDLHRRAAIILIDVDRFKGVNDSYGHGAGDEVLRHVTSVLMEQLEPEDSLARFGGDEFVMLMDNVHDKVDPGAVAERLLAALASPCQLSTGIEVFLSACAGIVELDHEPGSAETALQHADAALHEAKRSGPGSVRRHVDAIVRSSRDRLVLETRLRRAWRDGEFTIAYQPQVDVTSGLIVGAEALLRWASADEGDITPATFIPIAEEIGLMPAIGAWVLREACRQAQEWVRTGLPPLRMAVNVTARQLHNSRFTTEVKQALATTGFDGTCLELELTESTLLAPTGVIRDLLADLTGQGITLAIDDFGTGYSSFAYLHRLPVSMLKIDRSFVMAIDAAGHDRSIAAAIISMGHDLGLQVLAEGVETVEQLAFLRAQGCDLFQGFLVSPAVHPEAFAKLVLSQG